MSDINDPYVFINMLASRTPNYPAGVTDDTISDPEEQAPPIRYEDLPTPRQDKIRDAATDGCGREFIGELLCHLGSSEPSEKKQQALLDDLIGKLRTMVEDECGTAYEQ